MKFSAKNPALRVAAKRYEPRSQQTASIRPTRNKVRRTAAVERKKQKPNEIDLTSEETEKKMKVAKATRRANQTLKNLLKNNGKKAQLITIAKKQ